MLSHLADFQKCHFCAKKFFTKTVLKLHLEEVHDVRQLSNKEDKKQNKELETKSAGECDTLATISTNKNTLTTKEDNQGKEKQFSNKKNTKLSY